MKKSNAHLIIAFCITAILLPNYGFAVGSPFHCAPIHFRCVYMRAYLPPNGKVGLDKVYQGHSYQMNAQGKGKTCYPYHCIDGKGSVRTNGVDVVDKIVSEHCMKNGLPRDFPNKGFNVLGIKLDGSMQIYWGGSYCVGQTKCEDFCKDGDWDHGQFP